MRTSALERALFVQTFSEAWFLKTMLQKLTFSQVLKKHFAGVNRHQGTLKVQGP